MKHVMFAAPLTAMIAAAALAQTDTTVGATVDAATGATTGAAVGTEASVDAGASVDTFGTNWPLSVGTTFFTDGDSATLRTTEEIGAGWQSLSQEDRDMIKADCEAFMAAHSDAAADSSASGTTTEGASGAAATDTTTSGTAATDAGTVEAETSAATDAATTAPAGYDMAEMRAICEAALKL